MAAVDAPLQFDNTVCIFSKGRSCGTLDLDIDVSKEDFSNAGETSVALACARNSVENNYSFYQQRRLCNSNKIPFVNNSRTTTQVSLSNFSKFYISVFVSRTHVSCVVQTALVW